MSGNSAFTLRQGRGWARGLDNFLRSELAGWFGTRTWLTQLLIWCGIIDGIMLMTMLSMRKEAGMAEALNIGAMLYTLFTGMFAAVGVIIIMQDAIVGEKQSGTAAWVLSKPVSREAFVVTKLTGNLAGILAMIILAPGLIAYVLLSQLGAGEWLPFLPFLAAMGCLAVALIFFQTLTLMLGTLFNNRGAVIGLGLAFLFGQQFLIQIVPALYEMLPVGIYLPVEGSETTLASALILGQPVPSFAPVLWCVGFSILFTLIGVWKFQKTEF